MVDLSIGSKRLFRELQEIRACPVPDICINPVGNNDLTEWHGNIRGDPCWGDVILHFKVLVPTSYPINPPRVVLSTFVPHINVVRRRGEWEVCLDMLESPDTGFGQQLTIKYRYWSSAYTIRSILVQLKSFLLTEGQPMSNSEGGLERVARESREYTCPHQQCQHCVRRITPSFPSAEDIEAAPFCYPTIKITGEMGAIRLSKCSEVLGDFTDEESTVDSNKESDMLPESIAMAAATAEAEKETISEEKWITVDAKKRHPLGKFYSSVATQCNALIEPAAASIKPLASVNNIYSVIAGAEFARCDACGVQRLKEDFTKSAWKNIGKKDMELCCMQCSKLKPAVTVPTDTANRNFLRREKKRQQNLQVQKPSQSVPFKIKLCSDNVSTDGSAISEAIRAKAAPMSQSIRAAGKLTRLPRDVVVGCGSSNGVSFRTNDAAVDGICSFLDLSDILNLGQTCKSMHQQLDNDWWLWRDLFLRRFGRNSALVPCGATSSDLKQAWKYAYLLQANCLTDELQCYHTRVTSTDADVILGVPIDYTVNPKTGLLDYVTSTFDIISYNAYSTHGVRRTVWGEKFQAFLPLFIDEQHFMRGMQRLLHIGVHLMTPKPTDAAPRRQPMRSSNSNWRQKEEKPAELEDLWTPKTAPEMVMALLVKMMNTQVVLLCDNGINASENALTGYCQLHRIMLAFSAKFPQLRKQADKRLEAFILDPRRRVKQYTPSLGDLICMLTISERYQWGDIAMLYLFESFDRAVLWACSKDNTLINLTKGDMSRLDKFLAAHAVGLKLCLFHAVFLDLLVNTGTTRSNRLRECAARYDLFLGRPPLHTRRRWHLAVKNILELRSWPQFFAIGRFPRIPSPAQLLEALECAVQHSLSKGYHNSRTKFENVMKSGVSRILLKGSSYTVDPGVKKLKLCERWNYDGATVFLDASCLIYDYNGALVGLVDYSHMSWTSADARSYRGYDAISCGIPHNNGGGFRGHTPVAAPVQHSGDIVSNGVGQHTIDVDLAKMPDFVCALVFTISAWTTSLVEIQRPSAHLFDVKADTELCSYQFEDRDTGDNTAVIMCKLQRKNPVSRWEMIIIGHVGKGRADHYSTILEDVISHKILKLKGKSGDLSSSSDEDDEQHNKETTS